ncbi:MAG: UDP-N-acetylmuramate dehydrogenase [Micrococcales bacterium]
MTKPLSELTTIRVGGVPASLVKAFNRDALIEETQRVWATGEDWFVLGGGSNVVVADEISELNVIKVANRGIEKVGHGAIRVQAGENWDDVVRYTVEHQLGGIESLSGIPGTMGDAPVQNIGAYGSELADVFVRCEFLDYLTGEIEIIEKADAGFAYRDSMFKRGKLGVITWVELQLLADLPAGSGELLKRRREEVLELRASKGMVLSDSDLDTHSCGSFFTNPIVSSSFTRDLPDDAPAWPVDEDGKLIKLSAAWLIEKSGITKGLQLGQSNAGVSTKHALAITNRGGATAKEVGELARFIQERVSNTFGITLAPEPNFIGF